MKYASHIYARALVEAIASSKGKRDNEIVKNFLALIRRNGDESNLGKILIEAERFSRKNDGTRKIVVASARPLSKSATTLVKSIVKPGDGLEERIDPALVAGIKITVDDELQFDASLKGKLDKLFGTL